MATIDFEKMAENAFQSALYSLSTEKDAWEDKLHHKLIEYLQEFFRTEDIPEIELGDFSTITWLDYPIRKIHYLVSVGKAKFLALYRISDDTIYITGLELTNYAGTPKSNFEDALLYGKTVVDSVERLGELLSACKKVFEVEND